MPRGGGIGGDHGGDGAYDLTRISRKSQMTTGTNTTVPIAGRVGQKVGTGVGDT